MPGSLGRRRSQPDRFGADAPVRLEAGHHLGRDRAPQQRLDVAQEGCLVHAHERDRLAADAGAPGPPDPVDVVLGHHRQLVVHDVGQQLDVQAAGGDVGGDEDPHPTGLEVAQGTDPLWLALVAVDRGGVDPVPTQLLGQPVGPVLGAREHQRLRDPTRRHEVSQQLALALAVHGEDQLLDQLCRRVAGRHLDTGGIPQDLVGQGPHVVGEGGGEQQVLPALGEQRDDPPNVADEAHVEQPVRLVEDEDLDPGQVDRALGDVVQQPAGRGDHDLGTGPQPGDLGLEADAPVDRRRADRPLGAIGANALLDLDRQLARRDHDQDPDRRTGRCRRPARGLVQSRPGSVEPRRRRRERRGGDALGVQDPEDRQHEGRRLAGPGLGPGEHVTTGEDQRDRLALDWRGLRVALAGDGAEQLGRESEGIE